MGKRLEITVLSGVSTGDVFRYDLESGSGVAIGRSPDCELVLQDPTVSRRHARIEQIQGHFYISDLGSTHGTVHMGFQLSAGDEGKRELHDEDEFKVGDAIFRIGFEEEHPKAQPVKAAGPKRPSPLSNPRVKRLLPKIAAIAALLVVVWFLIPQEDTGSGVRQASTVLPMPQERVIGYFSGGSSALLSDRTHPKEARFQLPAADVVLEYDYLAEKKIEVKIDDSHIETLPPATAGWQKRAMVVRDILAGAERKLTFINAESGAKIAKWAVHNIRATPLGQQAPEFETQLNAAIAVAGNVGRAPETLNDLLRALQRTIISGLREGNLDGAGYTIGLEQDFVLSEIEQKLQAIGRERAAQGAVQTIGRHVEALAGLCGVIDAELWRRFNANMLEVQRAVRVSDYIGAHDALARIQAMFPEKDDHRWTAAERKLNDKKIVPARILKNPDKYRK